MNKALGLAGAALGTVLIAGAAQAASVTFDFAANAPNVSATTGFGNSLVYSSGGLTLTITAFGLSADGNTDFQTAEVRRYGGAGLGVCNQDEGLSPSPCDSPEHQVDNIGADDFVLFSLSGVVDPTTVRVNTFSGSDNDASYWLRNNFAAFNLVGQDYTNIGNFFGPEFESNASGVDPRNVSIDGGNATHLLFAARFDTDGDDNDLFKIEKLIVEYNPPTVPEPASLALFGMALAGLGLARRRRRA